MRTVLPHILVSALLLACCDGCGISVGGVPVLHYYGIQDPTVKKADKAATQKSAEEPVTTPSR